MEPTGLCWFWRQKEARSQGVSTALRYQHLQGKGLSPPSNSRSNAASLPLAWACQFQNADDGRQKIIICVVLNHCTHDTFPQESSSLGRLQVCLSPWVSNMASFMWPCRCSTVHQSLPLMSLEFWASAIRMAGYFFLSPSFLYFFFHPTNLVCPINDFSFSNVFHLWPKMLNSIVNLFSHWTWL